MHAPFNNTNSQYSKHTIEIRVASNEIVLAKFSSFKWLDKIKSFFSYSKWIQLIIKFLCMKPFRYFIYYIYVYTVPGKNENSLFEFFFDSFATNETLMIYSSVKQYFWAISNKIDYIIRVVYKSFVELNECWANFF